MLAMSPAACASVGHVGDYMEEVGDYMEEVGDYMEQVVDYMEEFVDYIEEVEDYMEEVVEYMEQVVLHINQSRSLMAGQIDLTTLGHSSHNSSEDCSDNFDIQACLQMSTKSASWHLRT